MDEKDFLELLITERMGMHHDNFKKEYPPTEEEAAEAEKADQVHELLFAQLNEEQRKMVELCEDAANSDAVRENEYYYRAGVRDGIRMDRNITEIKERRGSMEDEVFEKDYTRMRGTAQGIPEARGPKRVIPRGKADYGYLLGEWDAFARQCGGKVCGKVDCRRWQASITVTLPCFEFCSGGGLALLGESAQKAENVTFTVADGQIQLAVFICYFDDVY